jgi:hypothetical protein
MLQQAVLKPQDQMKDQMLLILQLSDFLMLVTLIHVVLSIQMLQPLAEHCMETTSSECLLV